MQHSNRFCNICEVRFDEKTPRSSHCHCPGNGSVPCRVEQLFGDIEKYENMTGRCAFCQVQMESLPPVPPEMRTSVSASRRKKEDRFYLQLRSPANMMLSTNREGARLLGQRYQKRKVGSFKKTLLIYSSYLVGASLLYRMLLTYMGYRISINTAAIPTQ